MNAATGIYNLVIMNLNRREDEGAYSCIVTASSTVEQSFVNIAFHDIPSITVFQANQRQEVNESSSFGLTCNVNSSTPTNMSIRNQDTGEVIVAGVLTDILNFTDTSAKCYQTAEYICTATNMGDSIESSPVKIFVNFSIFNPAIFYLKINSQKYFYLVYMNIFGRLNSRQHAFIFLIIHLF